nr:reverse transcriptase domain-containing protein [Tanacetum cinerariifolium]
SKKPFIPEESPVDTMADQRTMAKLLRAPTEGYAEAIVVPPIIVEHFELKHSLINMMTSDQFFGLEKDIPHDHIYRYKDLLRECTHHGFNELHQLDTFYNALNPAVQDSLNSAAGGNLLERRTQDVLTIIENKFKEKLLELANTPLNENCSAVILKKLPEKLRDPGKFLIPFGFSELKYKAISDLAGIARDAFVLVGKFTFPADLSLLIMRAILESPSS